MYLELIKSEEEYDTDANWTLDFGQICAESLDENMKPLCPDQLAKHLFSVALVGTWWSPHGVRYTEVVSYAAITGIDEWNGKPYAMIGGVITLGHRRGEGYAAQTVRGLIDAVNSGSFSEQCEYNGFVAKCNMLSIGLFEKLGFRVVGQEEGKLVMKSRCR